MLSYESVLDSLKAIFSLTGDATVYIIFIAAISAAAFWLLIRAAQAIIGEYAKRIWFGRIHRSVKATADTELSKAKSEIAQLAAELENLKQDAAVLIERNRQLHAENCDLRLKLIKRPRVAKAA